MAKLPRKVAIRYIGPKAVEEDTVSGAKAANGMPLYWQQGEVLFMTTEQAARLLFYSSMWRDERTEDDKKKYGPIKPTAPINQRYLEQTEEEIAQGRDVMPLVDVNLLDPRGLVLFAGMYLGKRLDVDQPREKLLDQVNHGVQGMRYEWA